MNVCRVIVYAMAIAMAFSVTAHTTAESNMVVRSALYGALTFYPERAEHVARFSRRRHQRLDSSGEEGRI